MGGGGGGGGRGVPDNGKNWKASSHCTCLIWLLCDVKKDPLGA